MNIKHMIKISTFARFKQPYAALAITCVIRKTSKEKLYRELGFESLKNARWQGQLCYLYEI